MTQQTVPEIDTIVDIDVEAVEDGLYRLTLTTAKGYVITHTGTSEELHELGESILANSHKFNN